VKSCDIELIKESGGIKKFPEFNAEIVLDAEFISRFSAAKNALPENKGFSVLMGDDNKLKVVVGYSNINTSKYEIDVKTVNGKDTVSDVLHFRADYLKEILNVNSDCESTILHISDRGLAYLHIIDGNFDCQYLLTPIEDLD